MSWAKVVKINSDLTTPLNNKITSAVAPIGLPTDAAAGVTTTNGVISYLKGVFSHLLTNASAARMAQIDTINTNLTAVKNTNLITAGSAIRSIQRGTAGAITGQPDVTTRTISIAALQNTQKCVLFIDWGGALTALISMPYISSTTSLTQPSTVGYV